MSVEYEGLKKTLGGSETAKEIDETEKRLKVWKYVILYVIYQVMNCASVQCVLLPVLY